MNGIWVCFNKVEGRKPHVPWAKIAQCFDCETEVWYDPRLYVTHKQMRDLPKVCLPCAEKRMKKEVKEDEIKIIYPHRKDETNRKKN